MLFSTPNIRNDYGTLDVTYVSDPKSPLPLTQRQTSAPRHLDRTRLDSSDDRGSFSLTSASSSHRLFQIPNDRRPGGVLRQDPPAAEVEAGNHIVVQGGYFAQQRHRVRSRVGQLPHTCLKGFVSFGLIVHLASINLQTYFMRTVLSCPTVTMTSSSADILRAE